MVYDGGMKAKRWGIRAILIPVIFGLLAAPFASILIQPPVNAADNFDLKQWSKRGGTDSDGLWDDVLDNYDTALESQVRAMMAYDVYRMCGYAAVGGGNNYNNETIFTDNKIFSRNQQVGYDGYIAMELWKKDGDEKFWCQDVNGKTGNPVDLFKEVWKVDISWSSNNPKFGYYCSPGSGGNLTGPGIFKRRTTFSQYNCNDFANGEMWFNDNWFPAETKPTYNEPQLERDLKKGPVFAPVMKYFGCSVTSTSADCTLSHIVRRALTEETPWQYTAYMMELGAACIPKNSGYKSSANEIPSTSIEVKKRDAGNEKTVYYKFEDRISNINSHKFAIYFPESGGKSYGSNDMFSARSMSCKNNENNSVPDTMNGKPFTEYLSFYNKLKTKVLADNAAAARAKSERDARAMLPLCESYVSSNPAGPKASDIARFNEEGNILGGGHWDDIENETFIWNPTYNPICRVVDMGGSRGFCVFATFQNPGPSPGPSNNIKGASMIFGCGGITTFDPDEGSDSEGSITEEAQCDGGAIGWLICPIVTMLSEVVDFFMRWIIEDSLAFNIFTTDQTNDNERTGAQMIRDMWSGVVALANIAFAIVFLVVIYSTATSTGLKNYDIKKIMPRLVICAIAVNTSFWICAAISDIINILGANVRDFLLGMAGGLNANGDHSFMFHIGTWTLGLVSAGLVAVGGLLIIFMNLGTLTLGLLLIVALMQFRTVAIIALIIISPLAFVAWLLPNTEKWFKMWWKEYTRMLLVYPMVMGVWGLTAIATALMTNVDTTEDAGSNIATFVGVILLQFVPVAAIIPIFKMGGQIMSKFQGLAQKVQNSKWAQDKVKGNLNNIGRANVRRLQNRIGQGKMQYDKDGNQIGRKLSTKNGAVNWARRRIGGHGIFGDQGFFNAEVNKARLEAAKKASLGAQNTERLKADVEGKLKIDMAEADRQLEASKREWQEQLRLNPSFIAMGKEKLAAEEGKYGSKYVEAETILDSAAKDVEQAQENFDTFGTSAYKGPVGATKDQLAIALDRAKAVSGVARDRFSAQQKALEGSSTSEIRESWKVDGRNVENGDLVKLFQTGSLDIDDGKGGKKRVGINDLDRYQVRGLTRHLLNNGGSGEKEFMSTFMDDYVAKIQKFGGYVGFNHDIAQNDAQSLAGDAKSANFSISGATMPTVSRGRGDLTTVARNVNDSYFDPAIRSKTAQEAGESIADYNARIASLVESKKVAATYNGRNIADGNTNDLLTAGAKRLGQQLTSMTAIEQAIANNDDNALAAMIGVNSSDSAAMAAFMGSGADTQSRFKSSKYAKNISSAVSQWSDPSAIQTLAQMTQSKQGGDVWAAMQRMQKL